MVTTPTGQSYKGLKFGRGNCGVSIVRSGEAMEKALQVTCLDLYYVTYLIFLINPTN